MAEQQRKMLQALMGDTMFSSEGSSSAPQLSMTDPKVCRSYLVGTCPHDLFTNTKNDLGQCPKTHSEALKAQYDAAPPEEKQKWYFEYDYLRDMQKHIDDCDRKIISAQKRLEKTPEEIKQTNSLLRQIADLEETIKAMLQEVYTLGFKLEKVNLAVQEHFKLRQLQIKKQELERELKNLGETGGPSGHQKLQVCDVCGAYLSRLDNDRRLADHFYGKMHLGYAQMRRTYDSLREEFKGRPPPSRDHEYGGNPNSMRIDDDRGGGFGRRGGFDGPRGGRGGWRGGRGGGYGRGGGGRFSETAQTTQTGLGAYPTPYFQAMTYDDPCERFAIRHYHSEPNFSDNQYYHAPNTFAEDEYGRTLPRIHEYRSTNHANQPVSSHTRNHFSDKQYERTRPRNYEDPDVNKADRPGPSREHKFFPNDEYERARLRNSEYFGTNNANRSESHHMQKNYSNNQSEGTRPPPYENPNSHDSNRRVIYYGDIDRHPSSAQRSYTIRGRAGNNTVSARIPQEPREHAQSDDCHSLHRHSSPPLADDTDEYHRLSLNYED